MAMIDTGGLRMHVQRLGPADGRPPLGTVVLVHGILVDSLASYYFTLGPAFAAAGLDVVMYDQRGHGRSERPAGGYHLQTFVADLDALLDRLEISGPVHLVGNSYGGTVCFGYAALRPERVATVSVIESEPATAVWAGKIDRLLARLRDEMDADEDTALEWIRAEHGSHTARLAKIAVHKLVRATSITRDIPASRVLTEERIAALRCPVLAMYGSESEMSALAPWLESLLPYCRTVIVPGQEHSVLIQATDRVRELTLEWILRHPADAPAQLAAPLVRAEAR